MVHQYLTSHLHDVFLVLMKICDCIRGSITGISGGAAAGPTIRPNPLLALTNLCLGNPSAPDNGAL